MSHLFQGIGNLCAMKEELVQASWQVVQNQETLIAQAITWWVKSCGTLRKI